MPTILSWRRLGKIGHRLHAEFTPENRFPVFGLFTFYRIKLHQSKTVQLSSRTFGCGFLYFNVLSYNSDTAGNITTKTVYTKYYANVGLFNYVLDKRYIFVYNVNGWKDQLGRIEISGEAPCDSGNCNCVNMLIEYFSYNTLG